MRNYQTRHYQHNKKSKIKNNQQRETRPLVQPEYKEAPIFAAMKSYARDGALAFHTPGHKQGLGAHPFLKELITEEGLRQEVSLMEELDDLHEPHGCIQQAEALAAKLWGAMDTLFIINGTTCAIQAMIMGTLQPGDKLLVPRNAHRSIIGGIILAGAEPVFIKPEIDDKLGIAMGLSASIVKAALKRHPDVKALLAVYPNYYGFCCDLTAIADLLHSQGKLLLVDEAHGAHLKFSDRLPKQALDCGADVVAQSTHKLLGSMTQTSMLHIGSKRVDRNRIRQAAGLLQSTSPNQLLLASLDIARLQMQYEGKERVERAISLSHYLRNRINATAGQWSPDRRYCRQCRLESVYDLDETKVTVNLEAANISGIEAEEILRHDLKIQCELSDPRNLLFIISMADTEAEIRRLSRALEDFESEYVFTTKGSMPISEFKVQGMGKMPVLQQAMSPREAFFATRQKVKLEEAIGRVSGETVAFYPPGVPIICPGEVITKEAIKYIRNYQQEGLRLSGPADGKLQYTEVIGE